MASIGLPRGLAEEVAAAFAARPEVVAVALAGSQAADATDERSDLDLYVYATAPIALGVRDEIAARFATRRDVGNTFWEPGDEWVDDRSGTVVDLMYRTPDWIEGQLDRVLARHEASVGYSTSFWHNVLHSVALFDRTGWYRALQERAAVPYPEPLRRAIIAKNHPILRRTLSSYRHQIELAIQRGDWVSVQHRVTALLASYFDVLFALNRLPHPGEKRLLANVRRHCSLVPAGFERRVRALVAAGATPIVLEQVDGLVQPLDDLLAAEGLLTRGEPSSGPGS
jgi:hypothetical protein